MDSPSVTDTPFRITVDNLFGNKIPVTLLKDTLVHRFPWASLERKKHEVHNSLQ